MLDKTSAQYLDEAHQTFVLVRDNITKFTPNQCNTLVNIANGFLKLVELAEQNEKRKGTRFVK